MLMLLFHQNPSLATEGILLLYIDRELHITHTLKPFSHAKITDPREKIIQALITLSSKEML